jgi:Spy/CpxP family protein refolding chaperone
MNLRLLVSTLALAGSAALAQQAPPPPPPTPDGQTPHHFRHHQPSPERQTAHLTKALNLTPGQAAKLEPILADRDQKMAALWQNQSLAPQDKHAQMKALHQSTEQQLATVLTPDQLQQIKQMHHGPRGHGPHGQWQGRGQGAGQPAPQAPPSAS